MKKISSEKFLLSIVQVYYSKNAENSTIYPADYCDFILELVFHTLLPWDYLYVSRERGFELL